MAPLIFITLNDSELLNQAAWDWYAQGV